MATITLSIIVADIDGVRELFDRIKVYRSTTGVGGPYVEISTAGTRPVLLANQIVYEFVDTAGEDTYFYRTSFFHATSLLESSLSDPQQGEGDPALDVISVEQLKTNFLFGVDLTDDDGNEFPDSLFQFYIKSAVSWVEHRLDIPLRPLVVAEEKHDYVRQDYEHFLFFKLLNTPVISVEEVRMVLPTNQQVMSYDPAWFALDNVSGQLQIIPGAGQVLLGGSNFWLPFMRADFLPNVFRIRYTAGFLRGTIPADVVELVGKLAAFGPLNIAGDLVFGAGLAAQSVSLDGLVTSVQTTQSSTNSGYGARLLFYWKEIKEQLKFIREQYKGVPLIVG